MSSQMFIANKVVSINKILVINEIDNIEDSNELIEKMVDQKLNNC